MRWRSPCPPPHTPGAPTPSPARTADGGSPSLFRNRHVPGARRRPRPGRRLRRDQRGGVPPDRLAVRSSQPRARGHQRDEEAGWTDPRRRRGDQRESYRWPITIRAPASPAVMERPPSICRRPSPTNSAISSASITPASGPPRSRTADRQQREHRSGVWPRCSGGIRQTVMYAIVEPGTTGQRLLSPDDIAGVCAIYAAARDPKTCSLDVPDDGCGCSAGRSGRASRARPPFFS